jgi:hypothetical protein
MELTERITSRIAELTGEAELLRKQLGDAERELERLVIAGQVITQLTADDTPAADEPGIAGSAQRGFGLLVPRAARHPARATCPVTTGRCWRRSPRSRPRPGGR